MLVENLPLPFDRRVWLEAICLREQGYTVSIICPKGEKSYREDHVVLKGINIYRYALPPTSTGFVSYFREYSVALWMTLRLSIRVLYREGFDVIHACNPPDLFFLVAWLYRLLGKRFVFDQHDLSPETFRVQFQGKFESVYRLLRFLEWLTYKSADVTIATNESVKQIARTRGGVPPERIFVVRTGPDFERLQIVPSEDGLKRGKRFLVAYLGVMGPQDGVDLALRAAHEVIHSLGRTDVHFTFLGKGDHTPTLQKLATSLGIDPWVEFTGRVTDTDLVRFLSTADVCISPDPSNGLNEFHTMNKTMEYMAMGKPVVAFDIRETRFSAAGAALYAEPNDVYQFASRIVELLDDPEARERLGRIGRERVEQYLSWDRTKPNLLDAYAHLFNRSGVIV
jgi:glycosyltransferase involved in cell wall biosynthesis